MKRPKYFWEEGEACLILKIPNTPPSGNHYIKHTRLGRHYKTSEAHDFYATVSLLAAGKKVIGKKHKVAMSVYLAPKQKGDLDNFLKCMCDAIVKAGVLRTDATITEIHAAKYRAESAEECKTLCIISALV